MVWILITLLSILPLALPTLLSPLLGEGPWGVEGASRFGLVLLPWMAFAGLPERAKRSGEPYLRGERADPICWWYPFALALLPLALAAGLDQASGSLRIPWNAGGAVLVGGPALVLLWRATVRVARGSPRAARLQAGLWLLFVPLTAVLHVALSWAPVPLAVGARGLGSEPVATSATSAFPAALNPLVWCAGWCGAEGELGAAADGLPLLLGVTLFGLGCIHLTANLDRVVEPVATER